MVKRIAAIILGLAIGFSLFMSYSDETHPQKLLIWYLLTPKILQVIVWITLFFVASKLVYGSKKDYSKFFYNLFVKIWGDPKKDSNKR